MSTSIIIVTDASTSSIDALVTDAVITRTNIDTIIKTTSKSNILQSATTPVASARGMLLYPIVLYFLQTKSSSWRKKFSELPSNLFCHRFTSYVTGIENLRLWSICD